MRGLELATVLDHYFLASLAKVEANSLNLLDNVHSLGDRVDPGQDSGSLVVQGEVLVAELGAVDSASTEKVTQQGLMRGFILFLILSSFFLGFNSFHLEFFLKKC